MNIKKKYYSEKKLLPIWFEYPKEFCALVDQGFVEFAPWHIVDSEFAVQTFEFLKERYNRELVPIAYRVGSDTVACLEKDRGAKVIIINGYTAVGEEQEGAFDSFWDWFRFAIEELIELNS